MKLKLSRPIVFFDLETTGTNISSDRIIEISILKVFPDESTITRTMLINPEMPIPKEASEVNRIYDEHVFNKPTFVQVANELFDFIRDCDLGGFNSNRFDIPLLAEEFLRANLNFSMKDRKAIDVMNIFHKKEKRNLIAAYKFYCDKDLTNAHSAEADTNATYEVLCSQLDKYEDLENDIEKLSEYSTTTKNVDFAGQIVYDKDGVEIFNFGKHKGYSVKELFSKDVSYYNWIMGGDFPRYTKKVLTEIKNR